MHPSRPVTPCIGMGFALLLGCALPAAAQTLYAPALGSLPAAQGWTTLGSGALGSQSLAGGVLRIDTSAGGVSAFGHGRFVATPLDTAAGFTLRFALRVVDEQHSSQDRAGFSLLVQGADQARALELGFWQDRIWALAHDGAAFVRAETALFDTGASLQPYTLVVRNHGYSLHADGQPGASPLLTGTLRDYPVLGLSTAVYGLSSFVFVGDNSSSAWSRVDLGAVALQPVPEPGTLALWAAGLGLLAGLRLRGSTDRGAHPRGTGRGLPSASIAT